MGETRQHQKLVQQAYNYILQELVPKGSSSLVYVDSPDEKDKPPLIGGKRPDLYYFDGHTVIIGEAKTADDFNTDHSKSQYVSYLNECERYSNIFNVYFIISVPWMIKGEVYNYFRFIKCNKYKNIPIITLYSNNTYEEL